MDAQSDTRPPRLTAKQRRFVQEYCVARRRAGASTGASFNGTKAAIAAGYSEETAAEIAYENLRRPHIRRAIDEGMAQLSEAATMRAEEILDRVTRVARVDMLNDSGKLHDVAEAKVVLSALELLGKYHKLWTERQEVGGMDGRPIQFALPRTEDSEPVNLPEERK